jgi:hypothetical protein
VFVAGGVKRGQERRFLGEDTLWFRGKDGVALVFCVIAFDLAPARRDHFLSFPMSVRPASSLWLRFALPILLFVVAGSTLLAFWMHASAQRESRHVFATLARTNADFIKSTRLPANERVADYLSRVLNMQVFFRHSAWDVSAAGESGIGLRKSIETVPPITGSLERQRGLLQNLRSERGIVRAGADFEAIAVPLETDLSLVLVRAIEPAWAFLLRPDTALLLGTFWLFSVGLAWVLARGFVRPLRLLAERLVDRRAHPVDGVRHAPESTSPGNVPSA